MNRIITKLPESLANKLSVSGEPDILLSPQTLEKQKEKHPDIKLEDYAHIPSIIDNSEARLERKRFLVLDKKQNGLCWRAVIKVTRDRRNIFLVSFHRIDPKQMEPQRKRGKIIRQEI